MSSARSIAKRRGGAELGGSEVDDDGLAVVHDDVRRIGAPMREPASMECVGLSPGLVEQRVVDRVDVECISDISGRSLPRGRGQASRREGGHHLERRAPHASTSRDEQHQRLVLDVAVE